MIVKRFFINFICIFIIVSCYGQEIDFDASYCYSHKNNFNFKIGDTVFSACYEDMMKIPFESVICSTLDTLSEYLKKQDKNIALIIAASQGTSIEFYNKENNRITGSDWRNITFKRANFAKQYLQTAKKLTNKIVCYGIGLKPYDHYPKEWWKSMCYNYLQIIITCKDSLPVIQLSKNEAFELKNIYFVTNKWDLLEKTNNKLDLLANYMIDNPEIKIEISGHTDNIGSIENNLVLSEKRAKAVKEYVTERGIDKNRIIAKGYGSSKPKSVNGTAEEQAKNRRVEVKIIK